MINIQVIVASVREGRNGRKIADWFMSQLPKLDDVNVELIDLADWPLPLSMEATMPAMGKYSLPVIKKWAAKISQADGFVVVTPEYNHGYPASLKNAIDQIYAEWQLKPLAFVGYGILGGARSIEQLVTVTSQIGMVPLPMLSINITDLRSAFDEKGMLKPENVRGNAERMLSRLVWWAEILQKARQSKA